MNLVVLDFLIDGNKKNITIAFADRSVCSANWQSKNIEFLRLFT
jgi:hypothetical protein